MARVIPSPGSRGGSRRMVTRRGRPGKMPLTSVIGMRGRPAAGRSRCWRPTRPGGRGRCDPGGTPWPQAARPPRAVICICPSTLRTGHPPGNVVRTHLPGGVNHRAAAITLSWPTSGAREDDELLVRSGHRYIAVDRAFYTPSERLWVDEDD